MTGLPKETFDRIGGGADPVRTSAPLAATSNLSSPQPWLVQWATGGDGTSATPVNEFSALNYPAFYSGVSLVAGIIASLPLKVYRKRADGGQDEESGHPAARLLAREFNPNTSAMTGREAGVGHLMCWGNSYAQIVRTRRGELLDLYPLGPDVVCVEANPRNELVYEVRAYDRPRESRDDVTLPRDQVLHVAGFSFDSLAGISPVRVMRQTLRQGLAQDRQATRFVTRGFRSPGVIELPAGKSFADEAEARQFRAGVSAVHNKEDGDTELLVLQDGAGWKAIGVSPENAQLLESRKFTRGEIAGILHIPPHLMGDVEKESSWGTGVEEQNIGFVIYCLLPILRRVEQEANRKLFRPDLLPGDDGLYVEHVLAGLLRGDSEKQSKVIRSHMEIGLLSVNEGRRLLGWNPLPRDVRYYPLNFGRVDAATGEDIPPPEPAAKAPPPAKADVRVATAFRKALTRGLAKCLRKEAAEAVKAAKKPGEFVAWVDDFYGRHAEQVRELFDHDLTAGFADRHLARSRDDLLAAAECRPAELVERVAAAVDKWHTERAADLAADLQGELAHA